MKLIIVVPAFNEQKVIHKVIKSLPRRVAGFKSQEVIVVNDGSTDDTYSEAKKANVKIISHDLNRGLGAAIKTGLSWAKKNRADIALTFDSDGQHHKGDIKRVIDPLLKKHADLVIGSRFLKKQKIPLDRVIINKLANLMTLIIFGVSSSDSQSGLRAFSKKALNNIDFKGERMDFSSEILSEAKKHNLTVAEVPIQAIYTDYSRAKGQKNFNAIPIMIRFLVRFLR